MNCLLLWGPDALVVAFRGTQSMQNIKADAKVGWSEWVGGWVWEREGGGLVLVLQGRQQRVPAS